jgi:hypothetical protein
MKAFYFYLSIASLVLSLLSVFFTLGRLHTAQEQNNCLTASISYLADSTPLAEYESRLTAIKTVCKVQLPPDPDSDPDPDSTNQTLNITTAPYNTKI